MKRQLAEQTAYMHIQPRWFRFDADRNVVLLTKQYDWYGNDFAQQAPSALDYAARHAPELRRALPAGRRPKTEWLEYDGALNDRSNKTNG